MTGRSRLATLCSSVVALLSVSLAFTAPGASAAAPARSVAWKPCPHYSNAVAKYLTQGAVPLSKFRHLMSRLQCGTVRVPLDYSQPNSRSITIAVTRLPATDKKHRLGDLVLNPGGPGTSGYLMPIQLITSNDQIAKLNARYNLIGFDPRGVGYSAHVECPSLSQGGPVPYGVLTEQEAETQYNLTAQQNAACGHAHPTFLAQMTTANVARDINQIRLALGDSRISYFGISWGTLLGAYYRSMFPSTVSRMWLDSVLGPDASEVYNGNDNAQATANDYVRMTAWLAQNNTTYGLGSTYQQVQATILSEWQQYQANALTFTDPNVTVGSTLIATTAAQPSLGWPEAGQVLSQLHDATGPTAPEALQRLTGGGRRPSGPPHGAPETMNPAMGQAVECNTDAGRQSFPAAWATYEQQVNKFPVTGELMPPASAGGRCAGWPLPTQPSRLRHEPGSLVLSGHSYETITPYLWARQMQTTIGGTLFTVTDDMHGSVRQVPQCSADLVAYFDTGNAGASGCTGVPTPSQPGSSSQPGTGHGHG